MYNQDSEVANIWIISQLLLLVLNTVFLILEFRSFKNSLIKAEKQSDENILRKQSIYKK